MTLWTFVGYTLWKLREAGLETIQFSRLAGLVLGLLFTKYRVVMVGSLAELVEAVRYIAELGYVELVEGSGSVVLKESLRDFGDVVGKSPLRCESALYNEYVSRIDLAVEEYVGRGEAVGRV